MVGENRLAIARRGGGFIGVSADETPDQRVATLVQPGPSWFSTIGTCKTGVDHRAGKVRGKVPAADAHLETGDFDTWIIHWSGVGADICRTGSRGDNPPGKCQRGDVVGGRGTL